MTAPSEKREETTKMHGVAAIPNRCSSCGLFKSWDDLTTHFVPDTDRSSEDESWRECSTCAEARRKRHAR